MTAFIRLVEVISKLCGMVAALLLLVAVLVVCQMVLWRYGLNSSTYWQTEFVTFSLIASTFIGAPYVLLTRGHVNVELLPLALGPRMRFALALFAYGASAIFCLLLTWLSIVFWHEAWAANWHSDSVWEPALWKAYLAMPVGFFTISLQYLADLVSLIGRHEPPFGMRGPLESEE